jgi:aspartate aminotransferase
MSTPPLASRLSDIQPSATLAISQRAAELRAQGIDILSFGVGEPDFATPEAIREAAKAAIDTKASHYTAVGGIAPLREAIARDSAQRRGGMEHSAKEVLVSVGAKHSLFNLAMALYNPGDEVIVPAPYWVSYPEQVSIMGAKPVIVETREEDGFCLTPEALERAITPRTKALVLCTPSNPTGSAYPADRLQALATVLRKHTCWVIVDEIYSQLVYDGFQQRSLLEVAPDLRDRLIIVDGVSKTYAMTGWRIGWILGPKAVVDACEMIQGQSTTNPTAVAQYAALEALQGNQQAVQDMRKRFEQRRNVMIAGLNSIAGIHCRMPEGAFYAFADVRGLYGKSTAERKLTTDIDVCDWMLQQARCAAVPGSAFGAPGYVRLSYATSVERIQEGIRRIGEAVTLLR